MKIQLLSYFLLGAATSAVLQKCSQVIPIRYLLLFSLLAGFLFCFAGLRLPWSWRLILVWVFIFGLLIESFIDFQHKIILDEVLVLMLAAGLAYAGINGSVWKNVLYGALTGSGLLGLIYILSKGGMGQGDVKYAGVLGIWTGVQGVLVSLYVAFLIGGVAALWLCAMHKADMKCRIPFGPCLSIGAFLSFFFSSHILDWYWSLFL